MVQTHSSILYTLQQSSQQLILSVCSTVRVEWIQGQARGQNSRNARKSPAHSKISLIPPNVNCVLFGTSCCLSLSSSMVYSAQPLAAESIGSKYQQVWVTQGRRLFTQVEGPAIQMRSLTCGDGAVSGVVVKSVKVFAALWAEIQRTWNAQEETDCESSWRPVPGERKRNERKAYL